MKRENEAAVGDGLKKQIILRRDCYKKIKSGLFHAIQGVLWGSSECNYGSIGMYLYRYRPVVGLVCEARVGSCF